jgi:predicted MFS family arabinose efflux permease
MAGGSLLGSLFSDITSGRFGRRDTLAIACIVFVVGSILMSAVQNLAMLIVSRVINGFAVGVSQAILP